MKIKLIVGLLLVISFVFAQEKHSIVKSIGQCWSGSHAVVADMVNGDRLYLGNMGEDMTKFRISIAMLSISQQLEVYYKLNSPETVCTVPRYAPEWFFLRGNIW
ncbi:MAG: hypothetical protein JXB49_12620 [Bacteroidales bacterium]|nr:hypothetical protein [Bacteroidales bacterium]